MRGILSAFFFVLFAWSVPREGFCRENANDPSWTQQQKENETHRRRAKEKIAEKVAAFNAAVEEFRHVMKEKYGRDLSAKEVEKAVHSCRKIGVKASVKKLGLPKGAGSAFKDFCEETGRYDTCSECHGSNRDDRCPDARESRTPSDSNERGDLNDHRTA